MKIQRAKAGIGTGRAGLQAASGLFSSAGLFDKGVKSFNPLDLNPYLLFDSKRLPYLINTMSNLPYEFLESVPVFKNLAQGSNAGGDALQTTALNQPRALPLIKNPQGKLGGYLYIPNVSGNYATGPSVTIGANQTWEGELDMVITQFGNYIVPMGGGFWSSGFGLIFENTSGGVLVLSKAGPGIGAQPSGVTLGTPFNVKYGYDGTDVYVDIDGVRKFSATAPSQAAILTQTIQLNQQNNLPALGNYAIQKAKLTVNNAVVFDCDFNGSTSIRHGDTKFKAAVGGFVSIASPELLINGNFDTDTAWTKTGGWSIADGVATLSSVPNSSDLVSTVIPVTAGKTYKIVVNVIATSGSFRLYDTGGVVAYSLNVGENVYSRVATGSTYSVVPLSLGSGTATIDSISVTEVSPDAKRDPITVVKKSVLRFDGTNDGLQGLFNQTITEGYMFAAFSVLGDGNRANNGRVFSINSTGGSDAASTGYITGYGANPNILHSFTGSTGTNTLTHVGLYSEENGDILHEHKFLAGAQLGKVNNADVKTNTTNLSSISSEEFNIGASAFNLSNASLDLEFLALFPASITDDQADSVRNYINNRNNVFDLKDGFGYYFFDAQKAPVGAISSGSSAWNGRIVGSDNGDTDKLATQATANDQPVSDGFKVTFADNSDHLDIPSTTQAGWQIVGTSLGTFAYRVNANAVTELNLLGNLGNASFRQAGDLYGIILLPESATGADIEAARKLLTDRGASDGTTASSLSLYFFDRTDIVEIKSINCSSVTSLSQAFQGASNLTSFPQLDLTNTTNLFNAWRNCSSLSDFRTTEIPQGTNFIEAWKNCLALTSFPAGAKLGTSATNVNFTSAWQSSGLESFPALDLSNGTNFSSAWHSCTSLTSFSNINMSRGTVFSYTWYNTGLTSFPAISFEKATSFFACWLTNNNLVDFASGCFDNWNPDYISNNCFAFAFKASGLSSQSVENILTSIAASGQYATSTGASGGSALGNSNIDIEYNVATGSLSAATNSAVTSLKAKGWSIVVNGVTL